MRKKGILRDLKTLLTRRRIGELLVFKGLISPMELKSALGIQKLTQQPLGEILLECQLVTRRDLNRTLLTQHSLRLCAMFLMFFMSTTGLSQSIAQADDLNKSTQTLNLASAIPAYGAVGSYPALFGMSEKRSTNLEPFVKWTSLFNRFENQIRNKNSTDILAHWNATLSNIARGSIKDMASAVNMQINKTPYITDKNNWGKNDYWETPIEFLTRGGDCEDFAITKYVALRSLGVPEERLRIAIVQDTYKNIPHAVLVVYAELGAYILDNQNKTLVSAEHGTRYRPIYSINRQGWWLHSTPNTTEMASAK